MRSWHVHVMGLVAAALLVLLSSTSAVAQDEQFVDHFDDPSLPGWEHSEGASVEDGVLVVQPENLAMHPMAFGDGLLEVRLRRSGPGAVALHYSATDAGSYMLHVSPGGLHLMQEVAGRFTEIASSSWVFPERDWVSLRLIRSGGSHQILFDGEVRLDGISSDPLPPGGVLVRTEGEATAWVDDLVIQAGAAPGPAETPLAEGEASRLEAGRLPLSGLTWVRLGGPPGGLGYDIRYSYDDPNVWFVTDANAGVHVSRDNGLTWRQSNAGIDTAGGASGDSIPIFCLTVDPHDPQIIWAGTDGTGRIYKSMDGGETWTSMERGIIRESGIVYSFRGFTVDPRSSDIVYAMGEMQGPGNNVWGPHVGGFVYKTSDGGQNWQRIWHGPMPSSLARYLWIDPRDPDVLYVSTGIFDRGAIGEGDPAKDVDPFGGLGILKSVDGGKTWRVLGKANGLDFLYVGSLYMHPEDPDVLFAATGHVVTEQTAGHYEEQGHSPMGIYRTTDGGEHWSQILETQGIPRVRVFSSVDICPSDPDVIYAGSDTAVFRSQDGGDTWQLMSGEAGFWGPPGVRAGWPIDMQCDPRDPDRVFANNYSGGNFLSEDGGRTWVNASDGYSGAQIIAVAADPFNPTRVFAGGRSGGWYSEDGGLSWNGIRNPQDEVPLAGGEQGGVAFDPSRPNHILISGFQEWVPEQQRWMPRPPPPGIHPEISTIVFAPSDPRVVYAGSANHNTIVHGDVYESGWGVARSEDGGTTWQEVTGEAFQQAPVTGIAVDPFDADLVHVATQKGLFRSADGGGSWSLVSSLPIGGGVRTVGVSPADPERMLAGVQYRGLFLTQDGGTTWRQVASGLEPNGIFRAVVFDPTNPQIVYASEIGGGVYRSEDGGESWAKIPAGLTQRAVTSLSLTADGLHLYAGTSGGGVFRLDLNGQPPVSTGITLFGDEGGETEPPAREADTHPEPVEPAQTEGMPEAPTNESGLSGLRLPCLSGALPLLMFGGIMVRRAQARRRGP